MSIPIADKDTTQLRFTVGDRVECNCGEWKVGTVVKLFYTQKSFKEGMCAPYQIQLDDPKPDGRPRLIFAPSDKETVVRKFELVASTLMTSCQRKRSCRSPCSRASLARARRHSSITY